jgi:hypothetical protein
MANVNKDSKQFGTRRDAGAGRQPRSNSETLRAVPIGNLQQQKQASAALGIVLAVVVVVVDDLRPRSRSQLARRQSSGLACKSATVKLQWERSRDLCAGAGTGAAVAQNKRKGGQAGGSGSIIVDIT